GRLAVADATLKFSIIAKDSASKTFAGIGKAASGLGQGLAAVGKGGALGLAAAAVSVAAFGPKLVDAAASMELMSRKSKIVFGGELGRVQAWAKANAAAMGMTKREATGLAANFADLLVPMGFTRKAAADMSTNVVGLSGALAQWSGGTRSAAEVSEILSAAMLGERDALQGLGISITQAEVDAKLLAAGQQDLTGKALQQAEALATQALVMEKSTDAQAAFATSSDTLAGKLQTSKARLKETGEEILATLTPALATLAEIAAPAISALADGFEKHALPKVKQFVEWFSNEGKFRILESALGVAEGFLTLAQTAIGAFREVTRHVLTFAENMVTGFALAMAWHPTWGPKLADAAASVKGFAGKADEAFGAADAAVGSWNTAVRTMKDEVHLKGDIAQLERKLRDAKTQLADKSLTKERRAKVTADIGRLQHQLDRARTDLSNLRDRTVTIRARYVGVSVSGRNQRLLEGRALGGPVAANRAFLVGERGPEVFVPGQSGTVVANNRLRGMATRGGGGDTHIHVSVNTGGVVGTTKIALENELVKTLQALTTQGRLRFT
ncbi:MAG: hypothetical protein ACRDK0_10805, partial [Solirubrobacteraceae bacterium]